MLVVHIGLGKTATTTLQRYVFPELSQITGILFNDREIVAKVMECMCSVDDECLVDLKRLIDGRDVLISLESLVDWNPHYWEDAADRNLRIFGQFAVILVTVREPESYLRSIYQQMMHEGHVLSPYDFFVGSKQYLKLKRCLGDKQLGFFDVDSFDLYRLYNIYTSRFEQVHFIPLEKMSSMGFLRSLYALCEDDVLRLQKCFANSPRENRSYSSLGVSLTLKRERLLNAIGMKSFSSRDRYFQEMLSDRQLSQNAHKLPFAELSFNERVYQFPVRLLRRLLRFFAWRNFIQNGVDKILPYSKYDLPDNVDLNQTLLEKNREFLATLTVKN